MVRVLLDRRVPDVRQKEEVVEGLGKKSVLCVLCRASPVGPWSGPGVCVYGVGLVTRIPGVPWCVSVLCASSAVCVLFSVTFHT